MRNADLKSYDLRKRVCHDSVYQLRNMTRQILLIAWIGLFGQIFSELNYNGINSAFDSRYNTTDPYNPALLYQFGERTAVFFQIVVNVTEGTFVDLAAITVSYNDYQVHTSTFNTSFPGSTIVAYGQVIDPCVFASPASTAVLTFNGTTDAKEGHISAVIGALDIPFIYNATVFEYTSPSVLAIDPTANNNFQPSRFYWLNFTGGEGESWGLDALATDDATIAVASFGNCPTLKFTNDSAYWTGKALANQTVTTGVVINKAVWYVWVQVSGHNAANVTFTWRLLSSSPIEGPAANPSNSPSVSPSSPANDALPQWALALLIVFGLVVGVLLVIVIVMCVKNRRRSTYQGV